MSDFEIKVTGLQEIKAALNQLPPRLAEQITRIALRQGANYMLKQVRAAAPVKTGRLRKAIKVKNSKINSFKKNGVAGVYLTVSPGKSRQDPKGAYYGKFVEVGYNRGSKRVGKRKRQGGVRVEGLHYVKDTFNATKEQSAKIIVQASEEAARNVANKLGFK